MLRDIDRAVELLKPLLTGLAEDRDKTIDVYADVYNGKSHIVVTVNNAKYEINVTAENVRSMIKSVIDVVALKL